MRTWVRLGLGGVVLSVCGAAWGVQVEPVYNFQLLGGQYFFAGEKGTLSGNLSGSVTPAMRFNDRWAVIPTLSTAYQGTKQVVDLVGAGTLFQEELNNRVGVRGVYGDKEWKWRFKPNMSFTSELLKETRDENWGKGLFDYRKFSLGAEAEYVFADPFSWRVSADYYYSAFPNYTSLESQAGLDPTGAPLARELAGRGVLDNHVRSLTASVTAPLTERLIFDGSYSFGYQTFPEQHVVDGTGSLQAPTREDLINSASLGLKLPSELNPDFKLLGAFDLGLAYDSSNQNSFDAQRLQFIPRYYNYGELRAAPSVKALFGDAREPVVASLGLSYWYRWYPYRNVQDASGTYQAAALRQHNWLMSTSLAYPMAPHFNLVFNFQYGRASSNQRFEQAYTYNYTATNYLFGLSYSY